MRNYYLYKLNDPIENIPKYIGITNDCKRRFKLHLKDTSKTKKVEWISKLKETGNIPIMDIISTVNNIEELVRLEKEYIKTYSELYELVNSTPGGEYHCYGTPILVFTLSGEYINSYTSMIEFAELYNLPSTAVSGISSVCLRKRNYAYNYIFRYINDTVTEEDLKKLQDSFGLRKPKSFYILDLDGNVINYYNSLQEALRKGFGKANTLGEILNNICGYNSTNGFIPCYTIEEFVERKRKYILGLSKNKCVDVISKYDINGNFICSYNTYSEASRDTENISISSIKRICNFKLNHAGEFLWRYGKASKIDSIIIKKPNNGKRLLVAQYSLTGLLIKIWRCCYDAAKYLNVKRDTLNRAAHKNSISNGYIWKYVHAQ